MAQTAQTRSLDNVENEAQRVFKLQREAYARHPYPTYDERIQNLRSLDRILVETDSPFLAPQKLRGTDNAPQNVLFTLAALAEIRDESLDLLVEATATNAGNAFPGLENGR